MINILSGNQKCSTTNLELSSLQKTFGHQVHKTPITISVKTKYKINIFIFFIKDIVLFNSADFAYSTQRDYYLIEVKHDGLVMWMFPDILRSYCKVDIKYFPFDRYKYICCKH